LAVFVDAALPGCATPAAPWAWRLCGDAIVLLGEVHDQRRAAAPSRWAGGRLRRRALRPQCGIRRPL